MASFLIVDDAHIMRRKIREVLTKLGHNVVAEASEGKQALKEYGIYHPDIVTMDINMPNMDGIETVRLLLEQSPEAKVVMISSESQKFKVIEAIQVGAVGYLIKPFDEKKMEDAVNNVLEKITKKNDGVTKILPTKTEATNQTNCFTIDNLSSIFHITIHHNFDDQSLNDLDKAINGLLFVKPLSVKIRFKEGFLPNKETNLKLSKIICKIQEASGTADIEQII